MAKKKQKIKKSEEVSLLVMINIFILSFLVPYVFNKRYSQPVGLILLGISIVIPITMALIDSLRNIKNNKQKDQEDSKTIQQRKANGIVVGICCVMYLLPLAISGIAITSLIRGPKTIRIVNPTLTSSVSGGKYRIRRYYIEGRKEFGQKQERFGLGSGYDEKEIQELVDQYDVIEIEYYETIESSCSIKGVK